MKKSVAEDAIEYANLVWQQFAFEMRQALRPWEPGRVLFHYVDDLHLGRSFVVEIPKWDLRMRYLVPWLSMQTYMHSDDMARHLAEQFTKQFRARRPVEPGPNVVLGEN